MLVDDATIFAQPPTNIQPHSPRKHKHPARVHREQVVTAMARVATTQPPPVAVSLVPTSVDKYANLSERSLSKHTRQAHATWSTAIASPRGQRCSANSARLDSQHSSKLVTQPPIMQRQATRSGPPSVPYSVAIGCGMLVAGGEPKVNASQGALLGDNSAERTEEKHIKTTLPNIVPATGSAWAERFKLQQASATSGAMRAASRHGAVESPRASRIDLSKLAGNVEFAKDVRSQLDNFSSMEAGVRAMLTRPSQYCI